MIFLNNSKKDNALGRVGDPKEIALAVASVCGNSYLTGAIIRIDGGHRISHF